MVVPGGGVRRRPLLFALAVLLVQHALLFSAAAVVPFRPAQPYLGLGIAFGALRWRLGTLWPLVAVHAAGDLVKQNAQVPRWWHLVVLLCWLVYAAWLLRPRAESA